MRYESRLIRIDRMFTTLIGVLRHGLSSGYRHLFIFFHVSLSMPTAYG
jgi:hypothetical protein